LATDRWSRVETKKMTNQGILVVRGDFLLGVLAGTLEEHQPA
jgi:hypothetical protein